MKVAARFDVQEFTNPRTGSVSWRVAGVKRDGSRVRQNFTDAKDARAKQIELETEFLQGRVEKRFAATELSEEKLKLAEVAFVKLGDDWARLLDCVDHWRRSGAKNAPTQTPHLDDAVEQYLTWLHASPFRDSTKRNWRNRMNVFRNSVRNVRVAEVTPDFIEHYLDKRNTSPAGKDTDRRAVSRFFSWCIDRKRRWATTNPCREVKVEQGESAPPEILTLPECNALLDASEQHKAGLLAPYLAACLFGGLRPFEVRRLQWSSVNLRDREIRLEANQTKTGRKTGRGRVIEICDTLAAWLSAYEGRPFFPANWRKEFDLIKEAAGFGTPTEDRPRLKPWTEDVARHTAISHYFRKTGSYGKTAEQFGNSEAIIKKHYQARVSTQDSEQFYAILPKGGAK
jgi:integrase